MNESVNSSREISKLNLNRTYRILFLGITISLITIQSDTILGPVKVIFSATQLFFISVKGALPKLASLMCRRTIGQLSQQNKRRCARYSTQRECGASETWFLGTCLAQVTKSI